jgi:carbon storage regulator CsrA
MVSVDWSETMGILVLSRKKDESVLAVVDGKVIARVLVVEPRGDRSRLGFEADESVKFYREEVWERMKNDNANAVQLHGIAESDTTEANRDRA